MNLHHLSLPRYSVTCFDRQLSSLVLSSNFPKPLSAFRLIVKSNNMANMAKWKVAQ